MSQTKALVGFSVHACEDRPIRQSPGTLLAPRESVWVHTPRCQVRAAPVDSVRIRLFRVAYSWPPYANVTSSIKPEVHNVSPEKARGAVIGNMHEISVKIGSVVPEICSRTNWHIDRQTYSPKYSALLHSGGGVIMASGSFGLKPSRRIQSQ